MSDYKNFFKTLYEEMVNADIEIVSLSDHISDTDENVVLDLLQSAGNDFGVPLEKYFIPFYDISDNLALHWIADKHSIAGEFCLNGIMGVFYTRNNDYWNDGLSEQENEFIQGLSFIDEQPSSGTGTSASFDLKSQPFPPDIWLYDEGSYFKMNIDYKGYIDNLLLTKAFSRWQYLFCELNAENITPFQSKLDTHLAKNIEGIKKLFPNHDYKILDERLEAVKSIL